MKKQDREAIKKVQSSAAQRFAQRCFFLQSNAGGYRPKWTHFWRSVRLSCPSCEAGYLVPMAKGVSAAMAQCCECDVRPLDAKEFWRKKASVVMHLTTGDDLGPLWPYILIEPVERIEKAVSA